MALGIEPDIAHGNGLVLLASGYDGRNSLANAAPIDIATVPGYVDLGAFEFPGSAGVRREFYALPESRSVCAGQAVAWAFEPAATNRIPVLWQWAAVQGGPFRDVTEGWEGHHLLFQGNQWLLQVAESLPAQDQRWYRVTAPTLGFTSDPVKLSVRPRSILHVRPSIEGGVSDGASWVAAYTNLQQALLNADGCSEIWVAAGTYRAASNRWGGTL